MRMLQYILLAAILPALGACTTVEAPRSLALSSPFMPSGAVVDAPRGYRDMCRIRTELCDDGPSATVSLASNDRITPAAGRTDPGPGATGSLADQAPAAAGDGRASLIQVSDPQPTQPAQAQESLPLAQRLRMLDATNRYVNAHVTQKTDMEVYGVEEYWTRSGVGPGAAGDCEDLAIEKRKELLAQGFPAHDLFYAVAYRSDLGLHAVLVAHTEQGDMVLDSRTPYIALWNAAPYSWVKRQSQSDPSIWSLVYQPSTPAGAQMATLEARGSGAISPPSRTLDGDR